MLKDIDTEEEKGGAGRRAGRKEKGKEGRREIYTC